MIKVNGDNMAKFKTDCISIKGYSHEIIKKECQDSSKSWHTDYYAGVIVCDGHGGSKYFRSGKGSKFACEIGKEAIIKFISSIKCLDLYNYNVQLKHLERYIINEWKSKVSNDIMLYPFENDPDYILLSTSDKLSLEHNPLRAYGTTFICAVITNKYYFSTKIGDGNVSVIYKDGTVVDPFKNEENDYNFNLTDSLCLDSADVRFERKFERIDENVRGIILTTDGVINCYDNRDSFNSLIMNVYESYKEVENANDMKKTKGELESVLHLLSELGSGDDLSFSISLISH